MKSLSKSFKKFKIIFIKYIKASCFSGESLIFLRDRQNCFKNSSKYVEMISGITIAQRPMHIQTF